MLEIRDIQRKDYPKAIEFALQGMHFNWYLDNQQMLKAYGRYFWYLEINRATQIYAAYTENQFVGVLLARLKNEQPIHHNLLEVMYVKWIDIMQKIFFRDGAGIYERTTKEQLKHYLQTNSPDGEIVFLASDPDCKIKGIGTALLQALEARNKGKTLYLFTDDACTYQFYEHRGFRKEEETEIVLEMPKGKVPLKCFLYDKTI